MPDSCAVPSDTDERGIMNDEFISATFIFDLL